MFEQEVKEGIKLAATAMVIMLIASLLVMG